MKRVIAGAAVALVSSSGVVANAALAQSAPPAGWGWVTDRPATTSADASDSAFVFSSMPPGWHITMGPGGLLVAPSEPAAGRFALESQLFLFPGTSEEGVGLFFGGAVVEAGKPWTAFVMRRDGSTAVMRGGATTTWIRPWSRHDSLPAMPADGEPHQYKLRVEGETGVVHFKVNGHTVQSVPRDSAMVDGQFGFRVGRELNLHVTSLDYIQRLAPPSARRE
ncbi:MAG: hypothetical protein ACREMH_10435 [Gemmatimonadales bacterium]